MRSSSAVVAGAGASAASGFALPASTLHERMSPASATTTSSSYSMLHMTAASGTRTRTRQMQLEEENNILRGALGKLHGSSASSAALCDRLRKQCRALEDREHELLQRISAQETQLTILHEQLRHRDDAARRVSKAVRNAVVEFAKLRAKYKREKERRRLLEAELRAAEDQIRLHKLRINQTHTPENPLASIKQQSPCLAKKQKLEKLVIPGSRAHSSIMSPASSASPNFSGNSAPHSTNATLLQNEDAARVMLGFDKLTESPVPKTQRESSTLGVLSPLAEVGTSPEAMSSFFKRLESTVGDSARRFSQITSAVPPKQEFR